MAWYIIQPAFTTGEISSDVSSRVDLEQYKSALLLAENAVIRPYGAVCRRQGSEFIGECKYADKHTVLVEFNDKDNKSWLLEFGEKYIRIWKDGVYTGVELETQFEDAIIPKLQFTQSADMLFICSGKYSVMALSKYSATSWKFGVYQFAEVPYEQINADDSHKVKVQTVGEVTTITSTKPMFTANHVGTMMKISHYMPLVHTSEIGKVVKQANQVYVGESGNDAGTPIYETVYTTSINNIQSNIKAYSTDEDISWKFTSHGTWSGEVKLQTSSNGTDWKDYRIYTSKNDNNVTDTGTLDKTLQMKVVSNLTSGSVTIDLSFLPYRAYGTVMLTEYVNETTMRGKVISPISSEDETEEWYLSTWNNINGYPKMCTFFQDRMVFAATETYQNRIWMSRTGDYPNFGVEKASGTTTDDSAVTVSVINRKLFTIRHLVPTNDLLILTDGNEWIIDGSTVITPSNVNPKIQTQHGCSEVTPNYIGNRCVYVQARGGTVRDMGYSYESDNYAGIDLTLFAKQLVSGYKCISSDYVQDPDSILYFVREDGQINCLTYIQEQKVYGWSHFITDGKYLFVESVSEGEQDALYIVVERDIGGTTKKFIEKLNPLLSNNVFMDSFIHKVFDTPQTSISVPHLKGKTVQVVADGIRLSDAVVPDTGVITLDDDGKDIQVGLPYETKLKQPSLELQLNDGTLQGRKVKISNATLRLEQSKGGRIGYVFDRMDRIQMAKEELFTGDISVTIPQLSIGFNHCGHVCIAHDEPYPFNVLAIIREVTVGGGIEQNYNR